ncbi:MAG TPA: glycosyltransferase family 9 protein [Verrucomicrobiae bacterium]|nr:glycosyltransferase family 9 protein [Verrucomicrobiae bacterium]
MSEPAGFVKSALSPVAGVFNRVRLGFPGHYLRGPGNPGGDLMCSVVAREFKKRGNGRLAMISSHGSLFERNRDVDMVIHNSNYWMRAGLPAAQLNYSTYDPERDADLPPPQHVLVHMCEKAGIKGPVELRPFLYLSDAEFAAGKVSQNQVVMQSSGLSAANAMRNKEWYPQRFQEVCSELRADVQVVQLGSANDPKLEGAIDLRGKTSVRQSAAILANSLAFVGLVGFLMHLARAVDCRSVILYGGREKPAQTGYVANKNLYTQVRCAPCWLRNPCEYDRKCMDMITVPQVIAATAEQISKYGTLLEVQTAQLT